MSKRSKKTKRPVCPSCYFDRFKTVSYHYPLLKKIVCRKCGQYIKTIKAIA